MLVANDKNSKRPGVSWNFQSVSKAQYGLAIVAISKLESAGGRRKMKEEVDHRRSAEGFEEFDHNGLVDDPRRIEEYRAIGLAEGLQQGSESEVLHAWQWLAIILR